MKLHQSIYPCYEAYVWIHNVVNEVTVHNLYRNFNEAGYEDEALLGDILRVYEDQTLTFDCSQTDITELFTYWEKESNSPISYAAIVSCLYMPDRLLNMQREFDQMDAASRHKHMLKCLTHSVEALANVEALEEAEDFAAMLTFLDQTTLSPESKYKIVYLYYHFAEVAAKVSAAMEEAAGQLSPLVEKLAHKAQALIEMLKSHGSALPDYIAGLTGVRLDKESMDHLHLYPSILLLGAQYYKGSDEQEDDYFIMGYALPQIMTDSPWINQNESIEALRAMLEKTKFEITTAITKRAMYNSEIADMLGLTSATVSHHMAELLRLGLVDVEAVKNRAYYSLRMRKVRAVFDSVVRLYALDSE